MLLISSPRFEDHVTPPGHPERPERAHIFDAVAARWLQKGGRVADPRTASREELETAHGPEYLDRLEAMRGQALMLDPDTFTSADSIAVATLAAGAAIQAVEHARAEGEPAFALVRPPGHHAERDRAMGFCLYNNAAVAAAAALARGAARVAVVDIDVHHGNGTQGIFYDSPHVLYISAHQFPFYPGTGGAGEIGSGEGTGFTVNIPLDAGSRDADYDLVFRAIVEPVLEEFAPAVTIVSAGFDAHEQDPLASMRVTTAGYGTLIRRLRDISRRTGSALALVTEGGYELTALARCLETSFAILTDLEVPQGLIDARAERGVTADRGERAVTVVRGAQGTHWRL